MSVPTAEARRHRNRAQVSAIARWCAMLPAVPAVVVAVLVGVATRSVLWPVLVAVAVYGVLTGGVYAYVRGFGARFLASLPIEAAEERTHARLHNLTEGLCVAGGVTKPLLYVLPTDTCNACTVMTGERDREREVALVVSTGLLDVLSRIELEGVVAQQLTHVRDGDTALSTFVAALASVPLVGALLGRRAAACLDPELETSADLAAAAMTRYPPGLAAALARIADRSTAVPGTTPATAHLWFADPLEGSASTLAPSAVASGGGSTKPFVAHPPVADRVEVLREL